MFVFVVGFELVGFQPFHCVSRSTFCFLSSFFSFSFTLRHLIQCTRLLIYFFMTRHAKKVGWLAGRADCGPYAYSGCCIGGTMDGYIRCIACHRSQQLHSLQVPGRTGLSVDIPVQVVLPRPISKTSSKRNHCTKIAPLPSLLIQPSRSHPYHRSTDPDSPSSHSAHPPRNSASPPSHPRKPSSPSTPPPPTL